MAGQGHTYEGSVSSPDREVCNEINFTVSIASPDPEIVSLLKKGDMLQVAIRESQKRTFVAVLYKDNIAGSIIERASKLASCIKEGYAFEAEVLSISGGKIEINVRAS